MFHMLTCFNLKPEVSIGEFSQSIADLTKHLKDRELIHATGPIGRRQRHEIMDTDSERDHEYFVIMSFRDREQCDRSVDYVLPHEEPVESIHEKVYSKVADPVFICWEDL
jgi:hypothetical protein